MKKLISKDEIPKYVAITTFGININQNKELILSFNFDFNHSYSSGYFNPHKKQETINRIASYWENNREKFSIKYSKIPHISKNMD